jgi:hypothetical protein
MIFRAVVTNIAESSMIYPCLFLLKIIVIGIIAVLLLPYIE